VALRAPQVGVVERPHTAPDCTGHHPLELVLVLRGEGALSAGGSGSTRAAKSGEGSRFVAAFPEAEAPLLVERLLQRHSRSP